MTDLPGCSGSGCKLPTESNLSYSRSKNHLAMFLMIPTVWAVGRRLSVSPRGPYG